jgi:hypothetical protein
MALPAQDHLLVRAFYKKYPSSCHISTIPFLNVGDVVEIQSKLKIWGTAYARLFTCWRIIQEIPQLLSYSNSTIPQYR